MGAPAGWARVRAGSQLLFSGQYYGFSTLSRDLYAVGSDAVLCGYPDVEGGHVMELWQTYGMLESCQNKDAAWTFLRTVLLAENQLKYGTTGFPSNNSAFYAKGQEAMKAEGSQTLLDGSSTLTVPANLSQEQYDAIWRAVQKTTARYHSDYEIFAAVWPEAEKYFAGTQDLTLTAIKVQTAAENYRTPKV